MAQSVTWHFHSLENSLKQEDETNLTAESEEEELKSLLMKVKEESISKSGVQILTETKASWVIQHQWPTKHLFSVYQGMPSPAEALYQALQAEGRRGPIPKNQEPMAK